VIRRDADILRLDLRGPEASLLPLSLSDVEAVRLILRGGSPIDWHRLNYQSLEEVDDFLRVNLLDPDDKRDMARLQYLHREAVRYLGRNFNFRFPVEVARPEDVRHLFLYASEQGRLNRVQVLACVVLKTMHTINHLQARELLLETAISEAELIQVVQEQLLARARRLTDSGLPIVHFYGSRKGRDSMVNKLLSKKASRASDILDKLRFRIVTEGRDDLLPVLAFLLRRVFPWNQVTADESSNNLLDFRRALEADGALRPFLDALQVDADIEKSIADDAGPVGNEFSGSSYRMINFIIDVPVRLDHLLGRSGDPWLLQKGSIVYVGCEFQVVDQETAFINEQGDNAHSSYKGRQQDRVASRLMWGLLNDGRKQNGKRRGTPRLSRRKGPESPLDFAAAGPAKADDSRPPRAPRPALAPVLAASDGEISRGEMSTRDKVLTTLRRLRSVPVPPAEDSMLEPMRLTDDEREGADAAKGSE
jgi:uncharacterized protein (TIGR04552 family)